MMETLIVLGATCAVFFVFLLVFFYKELRERKTGRRSGCQHQQPGRNCHCRDQHSPDSPTGPFLTGKEQ